MNDYEYIGFLEKEQEVYDRFANTDAILKNGIVPAVKPKQNGYLVIFRHDDSIAERVERLSEKVNKITPVMVYHTPHVHTTITDYDLTDGEFVPNEDILKNMSRAVHEIKNDIVAPEIFYFNWLTNPNTVIAAGRPDEAFVDAVQKYVASAIKNGLKPQSDDFKSGIRMPWGAHITTARYMNKLDPVKDKEKIAELIHTVRYNPMLSFSKTNAIDVGYFTLEGDKWNIDVYENFKLK